MGKKGDAKRHQGTKAPTQAAPGELFFFWGNRRQEICRNAIEERRISFTKLTVKNQSLKNNLKKNKSESFDQGELKKSKAASRMQEGVYW